MVPFWAHRWRLRKRTKRVNDFDRLAPVLQRALDQAHGYDIDDVRRAVEEGRMLLWPAGNSAVVTQIIERPRGKELYFFLAAGDLRELKILYPIIMEWGRELGCTRAAFVGRRGWERSFLTREEGWDSSLVVYDKEIAGNVQGT